MWQVEVVRRRRTVFWALVLLCMLLFATQQPEVAGQLTRRLLTGLFALVGSLATFLDQVS